MKAVICVLLVCVVALAYAQAPGGLGRLGGGSSSLMRGAGARRGMLRGGNMNQMLIFSALNGKYLLHYVCLTLCMLGK